ncbi:MAG: family 1 glycosylhydrolase, partial [Bdellovibrionota bacterium]|nr:family 1 glycosylhydrolase [Bdellovibrionota bacterium]
MINFLVFLFLIPSLSFSQTLTFPGNFQWCVATASHQIEGNNTHSDWWEFERRPGTIKNNDKSIKATDHWNRLEEDTQILVDLGVKSYRFSLEWAKIEPKEGQWNKEALEHYKKEILLLKKNNINPMVTLHHFSLPLWFAKKGGWANKLAPQYFQKYVTKVYKHLGDLGVSSWATFNEPTWNLISGYVTGEFPPGKKDIKLLKDPLKGVVLSHGLAYKTLHKLAKNRPIKVGFVQNLNVFLPLRWWNPLDHYAKSV